MCNNLTNVLNITWDMVSADYVSRDKTTDDHSFRLSLAKLWTLLLTRASAATFYVTFDSELQKLLKNKSYVGNDYLKTLQLYLNTYVLESLFYKENHSNGLSWCTSSDEHTSLYYGPGRNRPDFSYISSINSENDRKFTVELKIGGKPFRTDEAHGADYVILYDVFNQTYYTYWDSGIYSYPFCDYQLTTPIAELKYPLSFQLITLRQSNGLIECKMYPHAAKVARGY